MLKKSIIYVTVLVLVSILWGTYRPHLRELPPLSEKALSHARQVEIVRDQWGIPHVYGKTDADTAFGLAYAIAEDNYPILESVLFAAKGRLSLKFRSMQAIANDYLVGWLRLNEQLDEQYYSQLSNETRDILQAYAEGINYYAQQNRKDVDTRLYPLDGKSIAAGFVHKLPLFMDLHTQVQAVMEDPKSLDNFAAHSPKLGTENAGYGSNAHALHRNRSTDDTTRLNINSHQPWTGPVAWYEAHLVSDQGWFMYGSTFPGAPFILHGFNQHLGWAHTVNKPDLIDVFALSREGNTYLLNDKKNQLDIKDFNIKIDLWLFDISISRESIFSIHGPVLETDHGSFAFRARKCRFGLQMAIALALR